MPREFSEGYGGRRRRSEVDETKEQDEVEETKTSTREIEEETPEHKETRESPKEVPEQEKKELEETPEEVRKSLEDAMKDIQGMEKDLGHRIEDAREDLHDEFVNDMREKLEEKSVKETSEESKESTEGSGAEEPEASSESYIEGDDGMVYSMETGGVSESKAEVEVEESPEEVKEGASEPREIEEEPAEDLEQEVSNKIRESVTRLENEESNEIEVDSEGTTKERTEQSTINEYSVKEEEVNEPKKVQPVKESVEESQEVEDSVRSEIKEENREVTEEKADTEVPQPEAPHTPERESKEVDESIEQPEIKEEESTEAAEVEDVHELPIELQEEIEHQIDELVEELVEELVNVLEVQEETEAEQPRIIVDAMTGKEHIDRSLEYRPYFEETEEEEVEQEQKTVREKIADWFAELSEEAQEKVKEASRPKLETEEDLDEMIERNPSVRASPDYQEKLEDAKKYIRGKQKGEVPKLIRELWKDEVERVWSEFVFRTMNLKLREKLEDMLKETRTQSSVPSPTIHHYVPPTYEKFKQALSQRPKMKKRLDYKKELRLAEVYYKVRDELDRNDFSHMSQRALLRLLSEKYGIPPTTLKNWIAKGALPRLVRSIARDEMKKNAPQVQTRTQPRRMKRVSVPQTYKEFQELLNRHPYLREISGFKGKLKDVQDYYKMQELQKNNPTLSKSEISRRVSAKFDTARNWLSGVKPDLLKIVLTNEKLRLEFENKLSTATHSMMIEPSIVYNHLRSMKSTGRQTIQRISEGIVAFYQNHGTQRRITIIPLRPYNQNLGPRWMLDIQAKISRNRRKIEQIVRNETGVNLRLGQANGFLYIWNANASEFDYLRLYSKELFFFDKKLKKSLTERAMKSLGLKGNYMFSKVIKQITSYDPKGLSGEGRLISDLRPSVNHIRGEVLKFILDSLNMKLKDLEGQIERIGVGNQIVNPRFPDVESFKILMARLFASISSDGSIDNSYKVQYYEDVAARRRIVRKMVQILGKIRCSPLRKHDGSVGGFRLPAVIGRLLATLGMPVGDKILQGVRIPDFIMYGSKEVQLAYLQDLIPEEGCVTINAKDNVRIMWSRSIILYDAKKGKKYNFQQKISPELVEFIEKHGKRHEREYSSGVLEVYFALNIGDLKTLMESGDSEDVRKAEELNRIIRENPSEHIEDEKHLCAMNGIMTSEQIPGEIRRSISSDRVSVKWHVRVSSEDHVALWGLIASPNDKKKKRHLNGWMKRHKDKVEKARTKLKHSRKEVRRLQKKNQPEKEKEESGN